MCPLQHAIPRRLQEDRCSDGPSPDYNSPTHCFKITGLGCSFFTRHYWGNPHYQAGAQGATGAWHINSSSIACAGQAGRLEIGDLKGQKARWPFKSPLSNATVGQKRHQDPRPRRPIACATTHREGLDRAPQGQAGDRIPTPSHHFHRRSTKCMHARKPWYSNDPSAGSPTETLLQLLLPLGDNLIYFSQPRRVLQPTSAQSKDLTKPSNR